METIKIPDELIIKRLLFEKGQLESILFELEYDNEQLEHKVTSLEKEVTRLYENIEKLATKLPDNARLQYIPKSKRNIYKENVYYRTLHKKYSEEKSKHNAKYKEWKEIRDQLIYKLHAANRTIRELGGTEIL